MEKILLEFDYMFKDDVVSSVKVVENISGKYVEVHNYTDNIFKRMFGVHEKVGCGDLETVLKSRCFPSDRSNCSELLEDLGLKVYDPIAIVKVTHGLLSTDYFWLKFKGEELSYQDAKNLVDL